MICGSSPLTRGKHQAPVLRASARGLIPAHAGKTLQHASPRAGAAAHPRSRGENADSMAEKLGLSGSSPLTRGKLLDGA